MNDLPTVELSGNGASSPQAFSIGALFAGRYRIEGALGSGGMGELLRVHDTVDGCDLALKLLSPLLRGIPDRVDRFKREIKVLSKLRHPAVPRILAWGTEKTHLYFVSELVEGVNLKSEIRRRGPWAIPDACALTAKVAEALAAAHASGVVHRDVTPSNIMLANDGSVRLVDFGLARGSGTDIKHLTRTGVVLGTPGYMSPEQLNGRHVDHRSDIYSLGIVLFELLTGRLPFPAKTSLAIAMRHLGEPAPRPRSVRGEVPAWLERVTLRCLAKGPDERFQTASELVTELRKTRGEGLKIRRLGSGESIVEDHGEISDWALIVTSPKKKAGWTKGMALRHRERYYKLEEIFPPGHKRPTSWTYHFQPWPSSEGFRGFVDFE